MKEDVPLESGGAGGKVWWDEGFPVGCLFYSLFLSYPCILTFIILVVCTDSFIIKQNMDTDAQTRHSMIV